MSESDKEDDMKQPKVHWGEIEEDSTTSSVSVPDITEDIRKSMEKNCLDDFPDGDVMQIKNLTLPSMDPLMMYAIELHKWMNHMAEVMLETKPSTSSSTTPYPTPKDVKPIPPMPDIKFKHIANCFNFMPTTSSLQSKQGEFDVVDLTEPVVKKILAKCVATMTAHLGFQGSFQSVLDLLVDVLDQFFVKFCDRFVEALQEEESFDSGGFPNVLERVLVETGFQGAKGLFDYYQCRILKYINVLQKRCTEMEQQYAALITPKHELSEDSFGKILKVRIKDEEDTDIDTEMHFVEGDILTPCFELLNSMEAEQQNMQSDPF